MYSSPSSNQMWQMRNELLPQDRIRAIQEELAGFFVDHVINKAGEYHVELEFRCQGIVRDLILYICSQQRRIDIRKLVVRPISRRRRGRSLLSVYVHDDLLYLIVSFICLLANQRVESSLYVASTKHGDKRGHFSLLASKHNI